MRFALVNLDLGVKPSGLQKALVGQASAAKEQDIALDIIVANRSDEGERGGVHYLRYVSLPAPARRLERLFKARLLASVRELERYDVVFFRYPTAIDLAPLSLFRTGRARVVTIHHTKEVLELMTGGRTAGNLARAAVEYVQGRRILRRVDGIVGVTDEIRDYEIARAGSAGPKKPACTISNGIDVQSIPYTRFVPYDGKELRLVFVASFAPWHGVDRLMEGLRAYRGSRRIVVDLVGEASGRRAGTLETVGRAEIRHHGRLTGEPLDEILRGATIAISSLAMYRIELRQGCVLKTREYVARGLPFVLGYEDVDLDDECQFALRVPNDGSPLSVESLLDLAERVSRDPDTSRKMRAYAEQHLDWRVKVRALDAFARTVLDSK